MPESLRFLGRLRHEVELDLDLEFSPPGFRHFERRLVSGAHVLGVGLVEFKLDLFQPVGDVFVVDSLNVYAPLMGVVRGDAFRFLCGVEWLCFAAEDCEGLESRMMPFHVDIKGMITNQMV